MSNIIIYLDIIYRIVYNSNELSRKEGLVLDISKAQIKANIAQNLKACRELYGLKQKHISEMLGIDSSTYRSWETGRATPNIATLNELAKMFKLSINELCGIDEKCENELAVASPEKNFNKTVYGENKITDLDIYEKQMIMQIRRLTNDDKRKVGECINELLKNAE